MTVLSYILAALPFLMSVLLFVRPQSPWYYGLLVLLFKIAASTFAVVWVALALIGAFLGIAAQAWPAVAMGLAAAAIMSAYIWRSSRGHRQFEAAFGADWFDRIPARKRGRMLQKRWQPYLPLTVTPAPNFEQDIAFWTIPGTDRELLCDVWRPANPEDMSGLAIIYLHGSAWHMLDKDFRTRPMFRHLVSQGHTVMDVSYRLCPEVEIHGMVGDVKRAVAWMKANAARLGVDPGKIVLGGGSAGAHVALLAAYAPYEPELTPDDVKDADLSVCGAYSFYGPTNLLASYVYERQEQMLANPAVPIADPSYELNMATDMGRIDTLLGGHPKDVPQMYDIASPVTHVGPDCPPTFLALGEQDMLEPMAATGVMYHKLVAAGVPAVFLLLPWTDHAFDLLCPQLSPPSQAALYDFDRFLAILANRD